MDIFQEIKLLHKSYRLKNFNPSDLISTDYSKKKKFNFTKLLYYDNVS